MKISDLAPNGHASVKKCKTCGGKYWDFIQHRKSTRHKDMVKKLKRLGEI